MKNFKGITLVALVITIIILLILAGITIAQLTGSGLFENARLAEEEYKNAQEKENGILSEYESLIEGSYRDNQNYNSNIYDEWTTWLYLAGISNPEQYNDTDILANDDIVNKILNSREAIDYMLKSKYFILPAINNSEYKEKIFKSLLPTMTSNSQDGINISVSDMYANYEDYYACDQDTSTLWSTQSGNYGTHWLEVDLGSPKIVTSYYLYGANSWGTQYKFYLQARKNKESEWVNIEGDTIHEGAISQTPSEYNVQLNNINEYQYYRFYFPEGGWTYGSSGAAAIYEFKLFGIEY